jgi:hypothetical protein
LVLLLDSGSSPIGGWGWRECERGRGRDLGKIALGLPPLLCPLARGQREEMREGKASRGERERDGRLGLLLR